MLSLTKLLENNKDNLSENLNKLAEHLTEFRKSRVVPE